MFSGKLPTRHPQSDVPEAVGKIAIPVGIDIYVSGIAER